MTLQKQVMTIAGSDSGGGAGIQADLKTFHSLGVFGTTVITGVTAQNTVEVKDAISISPELVKKQFDTVMEDMNISAVKTGMLANSQIVEAVAEKLRQCTHFTTDPWKVIDPVLAATSGDLLLEREAVDVLQQQLIPLCDIITPNIPEAEILTEMSINDQQDFAKTAEALLDMGAGAVLIKGGHTTGRAVDHLFTPDAYQSFSAERVGVGSIHGTGCTLGAAICAYLAKTDDLEKSVESAKQYVTSTIVDSFAVGKGSRVLKH